MSLWLFLACSSCPLLSSHHLGRVAFASGGSRACGVSGHIFQRSSQSHHQACVRRGREHRSWLIPGSGKCPHFQPLTNSSGKFGAVCTCTERATGLKLAAKVIKKQTPKDKVVGDAGRCSQGRHLLSPATYSARLAPWCEKLVSHREKDGQTACYRSLVSLAINRTSHFSGDSPFWALCAAQEYWGTWLLAPSTAGRDTFPVCTSCSCVWIFYLFICLTD